MAATTGPALSPVVGSPAFRHPFQTPSPGPFQYPYPTPSPFESVSAASGAGPIGSLLVGVRRCADLVLRFQAFLFASVSAILLASTPSDGDKHFSFLNYSEFRYSITVAIIASIYSALQLSKGIKKLTGKGILISDKTSDYITFVLDQVVTYLLLSSSSVAVPGIERIDPSSASKKAAVASVCTLFFTFVVTAVATLMSGYRLCKRISW